MVICCYVRLPKFIVLFVAAAIDCCTELVLGRAVPTEQLILSYQLHAAYMRTYNGVCVTRIYRVSNTVNIHHVARVRDIKHVSGTVHSRCANSE